MDYSQSSVIVVLLLRVGGGWGGGEFNFLADDWTDFVQIWTMQINKVGGFFSWPWPQG